MSEHAATVSWERTSDDFSYEAYSRDHTWVFESGVSVAASAAPGYAGDPNRVDPEEAFVAAVASCHMLTFLAIAARKRLVVDGYRDAAVGTLEKNEEGRLAVTSVTLRPVVSFRDGPPAPEVIEKMHAQAHRGCFIANSVRSEIRVEAGS
jgi:organic hydroperoxide reductase OsmC/OhrA